MKRLLKKIILLPAIISVLSGSCRKEEVPGPRKTDREINEWIESVMRQEYLWCDDIPDKNKLKYDTDPETFFFSLLSDRESEGRGYFYSKIGGMQPDTKNVRNEDDSYGFEFSLYGAKEGEKLVYIAKVQYVLKDSPAAEAGLKRGDFIMAVDGSTIDPNDYTDLFSGGKRLFSIGRYNESTGLIHRTRTVEIQASRAVDNDPVFLVGSYDTPSGKTGYLVYNHFSMNSSAVYEAAYDESLRNAVFRLKEEQVVKLVLDLRYNSGGAFSTCVLLASMLAPESSYGQLFCRQIYNEHKTVPEIDYFFSPDIIGSGANLNLTDLYVLTGNKTASASETIIDCLRPYMNVTVIGKTTEGKNIGLSYYASERYGWYLRPVTFTVCNARMEADYAGGIEPDYPADDSFVDPKELGDPDELLLQTALKLIGGRDVEPAVANLSSFRTIFETDIVSYGRTDIRFE